MTDLSTANINTTSNYLVPSGGTTHAVDVEGTWTANPQLLDWRNFKVDAFPFRPQGVFIDNTQGTGDLTIVVYPIGWAVVCPAGQSVEKQFPAPANMTMQVTGNGFARLVFVDFPVLPSAELSAATINANIVSPLPLPTLPANLPGGVPYRTQEYVPAAEPHTGSITGAAVTYTLTPTMANQNLRRLRVYLTGDAAMAAAGENTITVSLNAVVIFSRKFYLPNAAPAAPAPGVTLGEIDADTFGLPAAAGNLVVTLATALSVGQVDIESYFTPQ